MKATKMLGVVERQGRRVTRLLSVARKRYDRLVHSASAVSDAKAQRRYIRAAEQTVASAEKIIAQLKKRIAVAKKLLPGTRKTAVKRKSKKSSRKKRR